MVARRRVGGFQTNLQTSCLCYFARKENTLETFKQRRKVKEMRTLKRSGWFWSALLVRFIAGEGIKWETGARKHMLMRETAC